jgi:hypothetical protein
MLEKISKIKLLESMERFTIWCSQALQTAGFAYFKDVLTGDIKDKRNRTNSEKDEERRQEAAFMFLTQNVGDQYHDLIDGADSPMQAWKNLCNKFDRPTTANLQAIFQQIVNLRCKNKDALEEHVATFNKAWTQLSQKIANHDKSKKESIETLLAPVTLSPVGKHFFFVPTLPDDLDQMVETLTLRDDIQFEELVERLVANIRINHPKESATRTSKDEAMITRP